MKILIVAPYPLESAASQRFRFEQYLTLLQQEGISYVFSSFWSVKAWAILFRKGYILQKGMGVMGGFLKKLLLLPTLYQYDFVFVHREATPLGPPWFEWVTAKVFNKRIIFDFDDAIWLTNTSDENRLAEKYKWNSKTAAICRWSYKVSCGNAYLRAFASNYNTQCFLIPTTIDTAKHSQLKDQHTLKLVIGWTGSHSTLPYLSLLEPVLQQLEQVYEFDFLVIADKAPDIKLKSLIYFPWQKETELQDLGRINIGVMPLPNTEWAKGKCALKALQYLSLGIPAVVSAVGTNKEVVIHHNTGFICKTEKEWYTALEKLLLQPDLRTKMGVAGKELVQQHYAVNTYKKTFLSLFE